MESCLFKAKITLAHKSSSKFFSSAKRELQIFYVFGCKASERAGALGPTAGTGNDERRTLRKSRPGGLLQAQASVGFSSSTESQ